MITSPTGCVRSASVPGSRVRRETSGQCRSRYVLAGQHWFPGAFLSVGRVGLEPTTGRL
jgi:hypothetical protein